MKRPADTYTVAARHFTGSLRIVRAADGRLYKERLSEGKWIRRDRPEPEPYLDTVRRWATWTVLEEVTDDGPQAPLS